MSPDPEDDDPSPDDSNPPPPPDDNEPPPHPADETPPPARDEAARVRRLHLLWIQWDEIRSMLLRMARSSGLPPTDGELVVDEVLDRLIAVAVSDDPPDCIFSLGRVAMRRLLGKVRKKGIASSISEDSKLPASRRLTHSAPGIKEFWKWLEDHAQAIESQLTALQWKTILATRSADTITTAANRCNRTSRDYRNMRESAGRRLAKKIEDGKFPPPPLHICEGHGFEID